MSEAVIIEDLPADPEVTRRFERFQENMRWFNDHAMELEVFKLYRGRWIAVSEGEMSVSDTAEEVERLAHDQHPDDAPHVQFIPRERVFRSYAYQRRVVVL